MTPQESFEIAAKEVENMNEKHLNRREYLLIPRELVDNISTLLRMTPTLGIEGLLDQLNNLPTAQFLDLEGVSVYSTWGVTLEPDRKWIKESDLTDKLLPPVVGPTVEELEDMIVNHIQWMPGSGGYNAVSRSPMVPKLASAILDRIKGGK